MRTIGLMSGTSIDGIDAALVQFETGSVPDWKLEAFQTSPYTESQRTAILDAIASGTAASLCDLNADLGEWLAAAALHLCDSAGVPTTAVRAIGSHGHTVWHRPPSDGRRGATLQLGCAATIAERTGIPVISDFRARDVAAGGHGAPLVPFADRLLLAAPGRARVLVNIGGMANLARVPPRGIHEPLLAFDTGPGNALIDLAVDRATHGNEHFDRDGLRAGRGIVSDSLLDELLLHPYFAMNPPKSTGREAFGASLVDALIERTRPTDDADWCNLIATLTALTATTVANAIRERAAPLGVDEVIITGGGASNPTLIEHITAAVAPLPVREARSLGIDPDAKEAVAFAALAWAHLEGMPGNVPEVTGAAGPRVLGCYTPTRTEA